MPRSQLGRNSMRRTGSAPGTSGSGVAQIKSVDGSVTVTPATGTGIVDLSVASAASWSDKRTYCVSYDNGNDANTGFTDVQPNAAGFAAACLAAAKKTFSEGLLPIIPTDGGGKELVISVQKRAAGANYLKQDGVTQDDWDTSALRNYRTRAFVATTDFSWDVTDRVALGAIVGSIGPNGDESWTAAGAGTVNTFTVDAAETLPAASTIKYMRIRFTPATATVALRNHATTIYTSTAGLGGQIVTGEDMPAAPAAGDTFWIERPGVRFATFTDLTDDDGSFSFGTTPVIAGFAQTSAAITAFKLRGSHHIAFCEVSPTATNTACFFWKEASQGIIQRSFTGPNGSAFQAGLGLRCNSGWDIGNVQSIQFQHFGFTNATGSRQRFNGCGRNPESSVGDGGSYFAGTPSFIQHGCLDLDRVVGTGGVNVGQNTIGGVLATTARPLLIDGGIAFQSANGLVSRITFGGSGASISVYGVGNFITFQALTGSMTDVGWDFTTCRNSVLNFETGTASYSLTNTLTGTNGDMRLSGPVLTTQAGLRVTNVVDNVGNNAIGTGGVRVATCQLANCDSGTLSVGQLLRHTGSDNLMQAALATTANDSTVMGVSVTEAAEGENFYYACAGPLAVMMTAAPTPNNLCYLSTTAGKGADAPPAMSGTNQKLRLGRIDGALSVGGVDYAVVPWQPELISILSDGVAP